MYGKVKQTFDEELKQIGRTQLALKKLMEKHEQTIGEMKRIESEMKQIWQSVSHLPDIEKSINHTMTQQKINSDYNMTPYSDEEGSDAI